MKLGTRLKKRDGLTKWQRYRLKDLDAYRKKKAEYARTPEERAKRTEYMRRWREKNREHHNALARASHHRNKHKHLERNKEWNLRKNYGIGLSEYQKMLASQNGVCAVCKKVPGKRNLAVDHDHSTGKIRKLLCSSCNGKLGWFEMYKDTVLKYTGVMW